MMALSKMPDDDVSLVYNYYIHVKILLKRLFRKISPFPLNFNEILISAVTADIKISFICYGFTKLGSQWFQKVQMPSLFAKMASSHDVVCEVTAGFFSKPTVYP